MGWTTKWSGAWPCLCFGEWSLFKPDGTEIDPKTIPFNDYVYEDGEWWSDPTPAYTEGEYETWYFGEDYLEEWETYKDGYCCDIWIEKNREWLESIADPSEFEDIYKAFQENDFRNNSCGGCV